MGRTIRTEGGVTVHARDRGPADAPAVVLLHGFPETSGAWDGVVAALGQGVRTLAVDLRGLGDGAAPHGASFAATDQVADVIAAMDAAGIARAVVAGHDLGAMVGWCLAAMHPDRVSGLVFMECLVPGLGMEELVAAAPAVLWHFPFHQHPDLPEHLVQGRERAYVANFLRPFCFDPAAFPDARIDALAVAYARPGAWRAAFGFYRDLPAVADAAPGLAEGMDVPVHAMAGEGSLGGAAMAGIVDPSLRRLSSRVTVERLEETGHWIPVERPEHTAAAIRTLLEETAP